MDGDDKIVDFRKGAPSARLKTLDWQDKRSRCEHRSIEVWEKEPILECADCGAVVDPYVWIRRTVGDWKRIVDRHKWEKNEAEREAKEIKQQLRMLRKEFATETEKRRYDSAVMILPPQNRMRLTDKLNGRNMEIANGLEKDDGINWKEWFDKANKISWQGIDLPGGRMLPDNAPGSTEAQYQAFKARFIAETMSIEPLGHNIATARQSDKG